QMTDHLVDPALSEWVLPSFSTTTFHDRIVGSVVMMASMKKYFSYKFELQCGIPTVTLLGTGSDWEDIRRRADKLATFGDLTTKWMSMLTPVLDQFVAAANNKPDVEFWQRICHSVSHGSGSCHLSGWITVFSVFDDAGAWQGDLHEMEIERYREARPGEHSSFGLVAEVVKLGGDFPVIKMDEVAPGYLTVDVKIDDNGTEYKSVMFAGHLAYEALDDGTSIQPTLAWAIALK
ncbi:hypothetical protein DYB32_010940, partial [Aphanomyces invadans]